MEWFSRTLRRMERAKDHLARVLFPVRRHRRAPLSGFGKVQNFLRSNTRAVFIVLIGGLVAASFVFVPKSGATVSVFYPGTCQGDWLNPGNAAGGSTLDDNSAANMFTDSNSAVLNDSHGDLTCGNFSGQIPGGSNPKAFNVKFHWSFDDGTIVHDGIDANTASTTPSTTTTTTPPSTPSTDTTTNTDTSTTTDTSSSTTSTSPSTSSTDATSSDSTTTTPDQTQTATPPTDTTSPSTSTPAPSSTTTAPSDASSSPSPSTTTPAPSTSSDSSTTTSAPASTPDTSSAPAPTTDATSAAAPAATPAPADSGSTVSNAISNAVSSLAALVDDALQGGDSGTNASSPTVPGSKVLDVRYTIDGTNWVTIGSVNAANWQTASFSITDPGMSGWTDLSKLQIGLFSADKTSAQPAVYVDSMQVDVNYDDQASSSLPTVQVTDPTVGILTPAKDSFTLDDAPTFTVIDPNLSADQLADLVRDNKATVISDQYGVLTNAGTATVPVTPTPTSAGDTSALSASPTPVVSTPPASDTTPSTSTSTSDSSSTPDNSSTTPPPSTTSSDTTTTTNTTSSDTTPAPDQAQTSSPSVTPSADTTSSTPTTTPDTSTPAPATQTSAAPSAPADTSSAPSALDTVVSSALGSFVGGASLSYGNSSSTAVVPVAPVLSSHARRSLLLTWIKAKSDVSAVLAIATSWPGSLLALVDNPAPPTIDAVVLDSTGQETTIPTSVQRVTVDGQEQDKVVVTKPENMFHPGKYTLRVTLHTADANIVSDQDFSWGVLALNVDRSIYHPNTTAYVQMGVISDTGNTICDAALTLVVTDPAGVAQTFTTADGTIVSNPACGPNNFISTPDYYAHVPVGSLPGTYSMSLTAITANGTRSETDSFQVDPNVAFDVDRTGPTRIYPVDPYPVTMTITPTQDWTGSIVEEVPSVFKVSPYDAATIVTPYDSVSTVGTDTFVTWNLSLTAGTPVMIGYKFLAPQISPEFYLLGPLSFYAAGDDPATASPIFQEVRRWQIADDSTCTATGVGSGNWSDAATWAGSCGHVPTSGDTVTINSGVTVTLDASEPASGAILGVTVDGTLTVASNQTLSTTTLTDDATGTIIANAGTFNLTASSGTLLTMNPGGVFTAGTSTITVSQNANYTLNSPGFTGSNALANVTINAPPTGTGSLGGDLVLTGAFILQGTGGGTFSTSASNYALTAASLTLTGNSSVIFQANGSTITLDGTSGSLFTIGSTGCSVACGTFTAGTSNVVMNPDASVTAYNGIGAPPFTAFYNLTLSPVLTAARTYTFNYQIGVTNVFQVSPSSSGGVIPQTLTFGGTAPEVSTVPNSLFKVINPLDTITTSVLSMGASFGALDIESGGNLSLGSQTLTLTGTTGTLLTLNGTGAVNGGTSTILMPTVGNVTLNTPGFSGSNSLNNLNVEPGSSQTVTMGGNINLTGQFEMSGPGPGTFTTSTTGCGGTSCNITAATMLIIGGSSSNTFLANSSTITLTGTVGPLFTLGNTPLCNPGQCGVFTAGTSTIVMNPNADVTTTFIPPGASTSLVINNLVLSPALTANHTYTLQASRITYNGNLTVNPTSASGTDTLTTAMTAALSIAAANMITVEGCSGTLPCNATGKLDTISGSSYAISTGHMNIGNSGILSGNNSAVSLTGTTATLWTQNGTYTGSGSNVTVSGASPNTTTFTSGSNVIFPNNLTITIPSGTFAAPLGAATTVVGTLTVTQSSPTPTLDTSATGNYPLTAGFINLTSGPFLSALNANGSTITLTGTGIGTLFTRNGTFNEGTSTVLVTSASGSPKLVSQATTFHIIKIATPTSVVVNQNATVTFDSTAGNKLWVNSGVFNEENRTITPGTAGTIQMDPNGTMCFGGTLTSTSINCNSGATQTVASTFPNFATVTLDPASTVVYLSNVTGTSVIPSRTSGGVAINYGNLKLTPVLTSTTAITETLGATTAMNINGSFTINPSGAPGTGVTWPLTVNLGLATTVGASTVGATTVRGTSTGAGTVTALLDTTGSNFALTTGAVDLESGGTLNARASTLTVNGNWTNNGTFTPGTSTVKFNTANSSYLSGSGTNTFNILQFIPGASIAKSVTFQHGNTFTASTFTVTGSGGALVKLFSDLPTNTWTLVPGVTANNSVTFADVQDSSCSSASSTKFINSTSSTDDGNNSLQTAGCWSFIIPYMNFTLSTNAVDFGPLVPNTSRYATPNALSGGSGSEPAMSAASQLTVATSGTGGYNLFLQGNSLAGGSPAHTFTPVGCTNTAPASFTSSSDEFGIRLEKISGPGTIAGGAGATPPTACDYGGTGSGYAYNATSSTSDALGSYAGSAITTTTYAVQYVAYPTLSTPPANYSTSITYLAIGNF